MKKLLKINLIIIALFLASCGGTTLNYHADKNKADVATITDGAAPESPSSIAGDTKSMADEVSRSEEEKAEVDVDSPKEDVSPNIEQNGLLTAGEWNDHDNWDFWRNLINSADYSHNNTNWGFYLQKRISVSVKDKSGIALNNIKVVLEDVQGEKVWEARTDVFGKAELFSDIFGKNYSGLKIIVGNDKSTSTEIKNIKEDALNTVTLNTSQQKFSDIDIMFVVDATGSMGDEIEFLKKDLTNILSKVNVTVPELSPRVGMVFYRDMGDEYLVRDFDFETKTASMLNNLGQQSAGGGGDFEEAVHKGLEHALNNKSWSNNAKAKLMFLILDAPPHSVKEDISSIQNSMRKAASLGIKVIPVTASGINKETEFLMRYLSVSTNGTYVFLTDDSGIGESHLVPTVGKYKVEYLNDLMIRLILKYTGNLKVS